MPRWKPNRDAVETAFARQRSVDPFGHRLHAFLGAVGCALICGPVTLIEFAWIPVAICFLVRYPRHLATHRTLHRVVVGWLILVWVAWQGLSILWSLDRDQGIEEWGAVRFAVPVLLLWPVLDRRGWLIAGLAMGMLAANGAQVAHAIGRSWDIPAMTFDRLPNRNSGWWQPVVGGTMLTAAVGLHLPAALTGRRQWRLLGIFGLLASVVGVVATGSRGAWLATAALLLVGGLWFVKRLMGRGLSWGHLPLVAAVLIVMGAAGYKTLWPGMRSRAMEGVQEIERILKSNDYSTYTGARIIMAQWGARAVAASPAWGIGAGSFKTWVAREFERRGDDPARNPAHAHCHNTFLHVAATTGLVGLALFGAIVVLSVRGGFAPAGPDLSGYDAGPGFALLGMLLVTPFDVINVNAQTSAVWWVLVGLCIWGRPRPVGGGDLGVVRGE